MADYMKISEARQRLGIGSAKMSQLLSSRILIAINNDLDKRSKLVKTEDVEALAQRTKPRTRKAKEGIGA